MTKLSGALLLLVTCTLIAACSGNQRVQSNYDDSMDFAAYKTYGFSGRTEIEDPDLAETLELYFSAAVARHLDLRSLEASNNPDLLINVSAILEDISRAPVTGLNCPSYENYNSRRMAFTSESRRPMCIYSEGSVDVDIVDARNSRPVFEGVSRVRLDKDDRDDNLLLSVSYDVANMFGESPTRATPNRLWKQ